MPLKAAVAKGCRLELSVKRIWQQCFAAFAGPGIHQPSEMMRVGDDEAAEHLVELARLEWAESAPTARCPHPECRIRNARNACATAAFAGDRIIGFYHGAYLWIAPAYRGKGVAMPLILAAAEQRGGSILPPGIVCVGYTARGLAAHRAAHRHAIQTALTEKQPVPQAIIDELNTDKARSNSASTRQAA